MYDPYANRWIVSSSAGSYSSASSVLLGVSATRDPTGLWQLYRIDADPTDTAWADLPRLAFNSRWIVLQANMEPLSPPNTEANRSHFFVVNKTNVYAGGAGTYTYISVPDDQFASYDMVPAITYDPNAPNMYALALRPDERGSWVDYPPLVRIYEITGDLGSETITHRTNAVAPITWAPGRGAASAPQLGTATRIVVREKTLESAVFRNGSLWTVHNIYPDVSNSVTGLQWWQISTNGAVLQFGRLDDATGTNHYGFPSLAVNARNDVLIGYSRFSAAQYASANYAFRAAEDPPNTLRADTLLKAGEAPFTWSSDAVGWGDYSNTAIDPLNDMDFWTIQEYAATPAAAVPELRYGLWWGRIVPPASWPKFTFIQKTNDNVLLSFTSATGNSYALERATNFFATNWQAVGNSIPGDGSGIQLVLTNETSTRGFYRLQILP